MRYTFKTMTGVTGVLCLTWEKKEVSPRLDKLLQGFSSFLEKSSMIFESMPPIEPRGKFLFLSILRPNTFDSTWKWCKKMRYGVRTVLQNFLGNIFDFQILKKIFHHFFFIVLCWFKTGCFLSQQDFVCELGRRGIFLFLDFVSCLEFKRRLLDSK